jgi:hypothetical protein
VAVNHLRLAHLPDDVAQVNERDLHREDGDPDLPEDEDEEHRAERDG